MGTYFSTEPPKPKKKSKKKPLNTNRICTRSQSQNTPENAIAFCTNLTINDFTFINVIGKRKFNKFIQVKKNDNNKIYALKVIRKRDFPRRRGPANPDQHHRKMLYRINNSFIVSSQYIFESAAKIYLVLDFFNGDELFVYLKKEGRFCEDKSRFYSAEIWLALQCIHENGIILRDLKPENIILNSDGHIKITDYDIDRNGIIGNMIIHSFMGTPEYLAPEILQEMGNNVAVDSWSFGCLLYEMMTGIPPFYNQNLNIMFERILHETLSFPEYMSENAKSLLLGLLERDPKKRLIGCRECDFVKINCALLSVLEIYDADYDYIVDTVISFLDSNIDEIEQHVFYDKIDFDELYHMEIEPPFIPKNQHNDELSVMGNDI